MGLPLYRPILDFDAKQIVNYNQTVERLAGVAVEPTALESTSIAFAYGLDLFLAPLAPSKQFDMLDVNLNITTLGGTLVLLVVLTFVLNFFAERKKVNLLWA